MHLYTLKPNFMPKDIISEFVSAIWTERYSSAGDVQLVTPASAEMISKLAHGTFLGLRGTREVMLLDTQSIEDGLLTVTGQSLLKFLDERPAWFRNPDTAAEQGVIALTDDTTAGQLISFVVDRLVIHPEEWTEGPASELNLNWEDEVISGLDLGLVDDNGAIKRLTINLGTLYSSIQSLAEEEGVGLKLYLESSKSSTGPVFRFATYRGKNRTSEQSTHSIVRLTPKMDSLSEVKEIASNANYKNVVYVVYKGITVHYAEPTLPVPEGFDRRVLVVTPEDIYLEPERYQEYRDQVARDAFANNNYVHAVDGQASPQGIYQYTVDYNLGDIIELEGLTGTLSKARITEYIRSQDQAGEREYPTLSVVDHLSTGTIPDTEPDILDPPWEDEDPDFDDDVPDPPEEPPEEEPGEEPGEPEVPPPGDPEDPEDPPDEPPGPPEPPVVIPAPGEEWPPGEEEDEYILPPPDLPTYADPGYWICTLSWEGVVDSGSPPEDWDPTWPQNDYAQHYGRVARILIGDHDISWFMPQGHAPGETGGGYVVKYEATGPGELEWPNISLRRSWGAYPTAHPDNRIPEPGFLPPIKLYLYPAGPLNWHLNAKYQWGFLIREEEDVPGTWTANINPGNVKLTWQYHRW